MTEGTGVLFRCWENGYKNIDGVLFQPQETVDEAHLYQSTFIPFQKHAL